MVNKILTYVAIFRSGAHPLKIHISEDNPTQCPLSLLLPPSSMEVLTLIVVTCYQLPI